MKTKIFSIAIAAAVIATACNDSSTETTSSDSSSVNTSSGTTGSTETSNSSTETTTSLNSSFDESGSYVDLKTNKPVRFKRSPDSQYLVDFETNEPFSYFFYNPATRDTFDRYGNVVNTYIMKGTDGMYTLDENRWKTRVDSDGDIKMKDGDETKVKIDASSGRVKVKTADTTIKQ